MEMQNESSIHWKLSEMKEQLQDPQKIVLEKRGEIDRKMHRHPYPHRQTLNDKNISFSISCLDNFKTD
jgi:hypothetical protein